MSDAEVQVIDDGQDLRVTFHAKGDGYTPFGSFVTRDEADRLRPHREPDIHRVDLSGPLMDVVAWGGDGTVNEVGSALAFRNASIGIVPSGSGNGQFNGTDWSLSANWCSHDAGELRVVLEALNVAQLRARAHLDAADHLVEQRSPGARPDPLRPHRAPAGLPHAHDGHRRRHHRRLMRSTVKDGCGSMPRSARPGTRQGVLG